jgi:hypothetical protein
MEELLWCARETCLELESAVRTREKAIFKTYCAELGERRFRQGFSVDELVAIFELMNDISLSVLLNDPRSRGLEASIHDTVNMTFRLGIDQLLDTFEALAGHPVPGRLPRTGSDHRTRSGA